MKDLEDSDLSLEVVESSGNGCNKVRVENNFVQICI